MGEFRTWLQLEEARDFREIGTLRDAKEISRSEALDTVGIEYKWIEQALAADRKVYYTDDLPLSLITKTNHGFDRDKVLSMLGAFAQRMGKEPPDTLESAGTLKVRGPEFKRMVPPVIIAKRGSEVKLLDGAARVNAAMLLKVFKIRAFVIE